MTRVSLFNLLMLLLITGCSYQEPIEFLNLQEVKVKNIEEGKLQLSAKAVFNNPNKLKGKIKKVDIYVLHRGDTVATVQHTEKLKVLPNSSFSVPISLSISIVKLQKGLLSNLASLILKRSVELEFIGEIEVSFLLFSQKIPVNYTESIEF